MNSGALLQLAMVVVVGIAAQWLAWRARLPAIVLLLLSGLVLGPVLGFLAPDELLGPAVVPIVSLSVAIILFEGGMSLKVRELKGTGGALTMLVTVGAVITWVLSSLFAVWVLGMSREMAALFGAILIVTGPTVIGPLLRHVRPIGKSGTVLKWEGLTIDPIGAIAAVLTFEYLFAGHATGGASEAVGAIVATFGYGTLIGLAGALVTAVLLKKFWIPDFLVSPASVALVLLAFVGGNMVQAESGLVAVTVMGIALANQKWVKVGHILEFKENLRVLLISSLFVLLAARLSPEILGQIRWQHAIYIALLILVVRPASVFISTLGSKLTLKDRLFISLMAPRGIVAAAVASVFALRMGGIEGQILTTSTFLVIVASVVIYGFAALPVARLLGLAQPEPNGLIFVGSNDFSRGFASTLKGLGTPVTIIDTNIEKTRDAEGMGLRAVAANYADDDAREDLDFMGVGKFLALTSNDNANEVVATKGLEDFGRASVYRLSRKPKLQSESPSMHGYSGRVLFGNKWTYQALADRLESGWTFRTHKVTAEDEKEWEEAPDRRILLALVNERGVASPFVVAGSPTIRVGSTIVFLGNG